MAYRIRAHRRSDTPFNFNPEDEPVNLYNDQFLDDVKLERRRLRGLAVPVEQKQVGTDDIEFLPTGETHYTIFDVRGPRVRPAVGVLDQLLGRHERPGSILRRLRANAIAAPTVKILPEPVCGNGIVEEGEDCDDGGTEGGDGCSASCQIENS